MVAKENNMKTTAMTARQLKVGMVLKLTTRQEKLVKIAEDFDGFVLTVQARGSSHRRPVLVSEDAFVCVVIK